MAVTLTDAARKTITPRTAADVTLKKYDPKTVWKRVRERVAPKSGHNVLATLKAGISGAPAPMAEVANNVMAVIEGDAFPLDCTEVTMAGVMRLLRWTGLIPEVFSVMADLRGLPFALTTWLTAHDLETRYGGAGTVFANTSADVTFDCNVARDRVLVADATTYAKCKEAVQPFLEGSFGTIASIAFAFPHEEEWVKTAANRFLTAQSVRHFPLSVFYASLTDEDLMTQILAKRTYARPMEDLVVTFGERAVPMIANVLDTPTRDRDDIRYAARALALIESPEVARALAGSLSKGDARAIASEYFARHPVLSRPALAAAAAEKGRGRRFAIELLASLDRQASQAESLGDEATAEELPAILQNPPWLATERPKRRAVSVPDLPILPYTDVLHFTDAMRARMMAATQHQRSYNKRLMTEDEVAAWRARLEKGERLALLGIDGNGVPDEVVLEVLNEGKLPFYKLWGGTMEQDMLARFGLRALPAFLRFLDEIAHSYAPDDVILAVESPYVAAPLAAALGTRREMTLLSWIRRYRRAAVIGLLPAALGEHKNSVKAQTLLFRMQRDGHGDLVREIAKEHGKEVERAIHALLEWDPIWDCPKKPPKMPPQWRPDTFTRPRLKSGKALPLWAVDHIGAMLAFSDPNAAYVGLLDVRDACEPRSLAELAWDIERAWELGRAKDKAAWMIDALVYFADEEVTRRTTPIIKSRRIINVLRMIGTDAAVMELATVAYRAEGSTAYFSNVGEAEKQLEEIAVARNMTKDELEDIIIPTANVDEHGGMTLDYGSRTVRVAFDEHLDPVIVNADGSRTRALPPKRKTDDAKKVELAKQTWSDLKEEVSAVAARRLRSLERWMLSGRTWKRDAWIAAWVTPPLMVHLARRIVWVAEDGGRSRTFRINEDRTLSDEKDDAMEASADARIRVAYVPRDGLAPWAQIFEDYELVQPLAQIHRPLPTLADDEREKTEIERPAGSVTGWSEFAKHLTDHNWACNVRGVVMAYRSPGDDCVEVHFPSNTKIEKLTIKFLSNDKPVAGSKLDPAYVGERLRELGVTTL